jgi:hypothetical protein
MQFDINFWAVVVCGLASMVTGFFWYGPLFGNSWAKEMGWGNLSPEQTAKMQEKAKVNYPQQLIGAIIMAYVFAHVLEAFDGDTISLGLQGAFYTWLGFIAPVKYGDVLWSNKSLKLFFLDSLYLLLNLAVFAIILVSWK